MTAAWSNKTKAHFSQGLDSFVASIANQNGLAGINIIISLVSLGILLGAFSLLNTVLMHEVRVDETKNIKSSALLVRNNLVEIIQNNSAWDYTINDPENLRLSTACLKDTTVACTVQESELVILRDAANNMIFNKNNNTGFLTSGKPCTSQLCPIRMSLVWEPVCSGAGCTNPQVKVKGSFNLSAPLNVNVEKFNFQVYR